MKMLELKNKITEFGSFIYSSKNAVCFLWFLPVVIGIIKQLIKECSNNYTIFVYTYHHAIEQACFYGIYPEKFHDCNHYGPLFSVIIAPFAMLPEKVGFTLFCLFIAFTLYWAINKLPIKWEYRASILLISAYSMFVSTLGAQTNPLVAALIIGSFIAIEKKNDFWAACFIMLGTFIKLYGIVGLAFFFFSKRKKWFILSLFIWSIIFFLLPMVLSSPAFVLQSYSDWYESLVTKNTDNMNSLLQDISVMGMMRRISGNRDLSSLIVLIPAMFLYGLQYIRLGMKDKLNYRLAILASTLIFVVIFSTGSESPTYIIAQVGVSVWFILQKRPYSKMAKGLLIFVFVFTCFATSDLMPHFMRVWIKQYALKSLPCLLVWLVLIWQILKMKFTSESEIIETENKITDNA